MARLPRGTRNGMAADIVGLYLNPPENALVIAVDEKPSIQAIYASRYLSKFQNILRRPRDDFEMSARSVLRNFRLPAHQMTMKPAVGEVDDKAHSHPD